MLHMLLAKKDVQALIRQHDPVTVVGVCSMSMIEKTGWLDNIFFDLMIDAMINPVTVTKKRVRDFIFYFSYVHLLIFSRLQIQSG